MPGTYSQGLILPRDFCTYYISTYDTIEISIEMFSPTLNVGTYESIEMSMIFENTMLLHMRLWKYLLRLDCKLKLV